MYLVLLQKIKAAICYIAAPSAHMGKLNFQPDFAVSTSLCVHHYLLQEVTMIFVPIPNEKAAVATAASSAQMSAITGNPIVPLPRRNSMGFCSSLPTIFSLNPFRRSLLTHKTFPTPAYTQNRLLDGAPRHSPSFSTTFKANISQSE